MTKQEAGIYIKAWDKRVGALSRMTKRMLVIVDSAALANIGRVRIFGVMSKDELIADILECEFPNIAEARQAYYVQAEATKVLTEGN